MFSLNFQTTGFARQKCASVVYRDGRNNLGDTMLMTAGFSPVPRTVILTGLHLTVSLNECMSQGS